MGCTPCARRRKAAQKAREKKAAEGKRLQAAAIGAALAVTEAVGKAIGIEAGDGEAAPERGAEEPTGSP